MKYKDKLFEDSACLFYQIYNHFFLCEKQIQQQSLQEQQILKSTITTQNSIIYGAQLFLLVTLDKFLQSTLRIVIISNLNVTCEILAKDHSSCERAQEHLDYEALAHEKQLSNPLKHNNQ